MTDRENRPAGDRAAQQTTDDVVHNNDIASHQVSFWDVHEHVTPLLREIGSWPAVGSPAWCELDADDPVKLAAIFDAAQHWALRLETCQVAECKSSHAISAAADWSAVAQRIRQEREFYSEKPFLRKAAS